MKEGVNIMVVGHGVTSAAIVAQMAKHSIAEIIVIDPSRVEDMKNGINVLIIDTLPKEVFMITAVPKLESLAYIKPIKEKILTKQEHKMRVRNSNNWRNQSLKRR